MKIRRTPEPFMVNLRLLLFVQDGTYSQISQNARVKPTALSLAKQGRQPLPADAKRRICKVLRVPYEAMNVDQTHSRYTGLRLFALHAVNLHQALTSTAIA